MTPPYACWVCRAEIFVAEDGWPHTYHAEGCALRERLPCEDAVCSHLSGCGEDCHASCCPTCTGQAFSVG